MSTRFPFKVCPPQKRKTMKTQRPVGSNAALMKGRTKLIRITGLVLALRPDSRHYGAMNTIQKSIRWLSGDHGFDQRPHHRKGRFVSPASPHKDGRHSARMSKVLLQLLYQGNREVSYSESDVLPRSRALQGLSKHRQEDALTISWLGQSTFYFHLGGRGILTDPFLGSRASPMRRMGPKRLVPSPLAVTDLSVDYLVVSHNHYDHLCEDTLRAIVNKAEVRVVTTLGLKPLFRRLGFSDIVELDWYQQLEIEGLKFTALPAYHFSGRSLWDTDQTLWASFAIEGPEGRVFFAGDTGYGPEFRRIGELTGPYDLALVPIGAYGPPSVFAAVHATPEEAVKIGEDLQAKHLVGMHWGTIRLTTEPFWEPRARFLDTASDTRRHVLGIGETRSFK